MKSKARNEQRKIIMTTLYQIFLFENKEGIIKIDEFIDEVTKNEDKFVKDTIDGILERRREIDELANSYLNDWTIDRLGKIDQVIIRMGIYEILYTDTPDLVCIDEAIELAKQYSDDAVRKMINGVLDKVYHNKK